MTTRSTPLQARVLTRLQRPSRGSGAAVFNPASMFSGGEAGFYYNFNTTDNIYEDLARTTPASPSSVIGGYTDLSGNNNHGGTSTTGFKGTFAGGGITLDGVDDGVFSGFTITSTGVHTLFVAMDMSADDQQTIWMDGGPNGYSAVSENITAASTGAGDTLQNAWVDGVLVSPTPTTRNLLRAALPTTSTSFVWETNITNPAYQVNPINVGISISYVTYELIGVIKAVALIDRSPTAAEVAEWHTFAGGLS